MILNISSDVSYNTKFLGIVFQKIVCYDRDLVPVIIKLAEIKNRWTDLLTRLRCYSFISAGGNRFLSWCKDRNFFCNFQFFEQRNQEKSLFSQWGVVRKFAHRVNFSSSEIKKKFIFSMMSREKTRSQLWPPFDTFSLFFLCFVQNNQYLCKCIVT